MYQPDRACRESVLFSRRFQVHMELDGRLEVGMVVSENLDQI